MSEANADRSKRASAAKRVKNCGSKETYVNHGHAQKIASAMNLQGKYVKPYHCGVCKQWHVTSRSKRGILSGIFAQLEDERKNGVRLQSW